MVTGDNWKTQLFQAFGADDSEKQEAVLRYIVETFDKGGEQFYILETGKKHRLMPPPVQGAADVKPVVKYLVWFAVTHSPGYMSRYGRYRRAAANYPRLESLEKSDVFQTANKSDRALLINSIARELALGGPVQPRLGFRRGLPAGVHTVEQFVEFLITRSTPAYAKAVRQVDRWFADHPGAEEQFVQYYRTLYGHEHATR